MIEVIRERLHLPDRLTGDRSATVCDGTVDVRHRSHVAIADQAETVELEEEARRARPLSHRTRAAGPMVLLPGGFLPWLASQPSATRTVSGWPRRASGHEPGKETGMATQERLLLDARGT